MATPPSRYSTPSSSSRAPRPNGNPQRSSSYAPPSSSASNARTTTTTGGVEDFLSPVSKFNRSKEHAMTEQKARMLTLEAERIQRIASKQASRLGTPSASGTSGDAAASSAKRKLTELESAAAAAASASASASANATPMSLMDKVKKMRTSSPPRKPTSDSVGGSRRAVSHGGGGGGGAVGQASSSFSPQPRNSLSSSALKRHEERIMREQEQYLQHMAQTGEETANDHMSAATATDAQQRYLAYAHTQQVSASHAAATSAMMTPPPRSSRSASTGAQGLFARHADPSVQKTPPETTSPNSSPFHFPDYASSASSASHRGSPIYQTPVRHSTSSSIGQHQRQRQSRGGDGDKEEPQFLIQLTPRGDDGMVDLGHIATVSDLETVEGDDILSAMMTMTTPRVGRHFPSEQSRTASEEKEIQFLRRRRLASARRSIDLKVPVVTTDLVHQNKKSQHATWQFEEVLDPVASPSTISDRIMRRRIGGVTVSVSQEAQQARDDAENAKAVAVENDLLIDEDDDDDDETTETKVARFSKASRWSVKRFAAYVVAGAMVLCLLDILLPLLWSLFEPPRPYCDSNASMLEDQHDQQDQDHHDHAISVIDKSFYTALQPYRDDCRACPLFGVCSNGFLVRCLPPLEERNGACVESKEVQFALDQIAKSIEKYVVGLASQQVCGGGSSLPSGSSGSSSGSSSLNGDGSTTARVVVLLSELQELVFQSPFAETLLNISLTAVSGKAAAAEYIFNRSVDLALSSFQKISQVGFIQLATKKLVGDGSRHGADGATTTKPLREDMVIQFSTSIAPWSCRARNQLATHAYWLLLAVMVCTGIALLYRKWQMYKTKRALVDRLVKEVRYFLLGRSHRSERFYPANHLRDNLFDTLPQVSLRDRKWLRECVWPTVATLVGEDSRVHSHFAPIHGKQMIVWEWISSNSPNIKVEEKKKMKTRSQRKRYSI